MVDISIVVQPSRPPIWNDLPSLDDLRRTIQGLPPPSSPSPENHRPRPHRRHATERPTPPRIPHRIEIPPSPPMPTPQNTGDCFLYLSYSVPASSGGTRPEAALLSVIPGCMDPAVSHENICGPNFRTFASYIVRPPNASPTTTNGNHIVVTCEAAPPQPSATPVYRAERLTRGR